MWSPRLSPDGRYLAAISHDNKTLYLRDNARGSWRPCVSMDFVAEPVWPREASWIQFTAILHNTNTSLYRIETGCREARRVADLSAHRVAGSDWTGITPDGSPMALLRIPDEIYAINWRLRLRLP